MVSIAQMVRRLILGLMSFIELPRLGYEGSGTTGGRLMLGEVMTLDAWSNWHITGLGFPCYRFIRKL